MGVLPLKKDDDALRALVERALSEGPLTITRDGVPVAVITPAEGAQSSAPERRPTLTELILRRPIEEGIDLDEYIGPRTRSWSRPPPDFD